VDEVMKRYEARLQADLSSLRARVGGVARSVRLAIDEAVRGLVAGDQDRLYRVVLDDLPINREVRSIDAACHAFVARHLPSAGPLRFVSSVLRLNIALERIGDYAVTIGRIGARLETPLTPALADDIRVLADQSSRMLELATRAFIDEDAALARDTKGMAKKVDITHDALFKSLTESQPAPALSEVLALITIFHQLERVSDQAKNICEEAVFVTTGETKTPKVYRVHFVDGAGGWSSLTAALAQRAFPNSGAFSASTVGEPALDAAVASTAGELGLDVDAAHVLGGFRESPAEYHVVVALGEGLALPRMPFQTALQRWPLDSGDAQAVARDLGARVADLMEILRGPDAD